MPLMILIRSSFRRPWLPVGTVCIGSFSFFFFGSAPLRGQSSAELAFQHIQKSDCLGCHRYETRLVGPAFKEVAARYQGDAEAQNKLVAKVRNGGSGNWGNIPMAPHPGLTEQQVTEIVKWILSGEEPPAAQFAATEAPAIPVPSRDAEKIEYKNLIEVAGHPPITHLPPVPVPFDNPMTAEKVALGRQLFFDGRLSGDTRSSCFVCHNPQLGWGDGGQISRGYPGTLHWRNSQTVLNSAYYNKLFWDGSVTSLEGQAKAAATGGVGGNGDESMMEMRLRFIPEYVVAFEDVFGISQPRMKHAWMAIAAFERTLVSDAEKVPYDRYIVGDDAALSDSAKRGMALFHGKANCIQCHNGPLASDQKFHVMGVTENPILEREPLAQITFRYEQYIKGVDQDLYAKANRDHGLYYVTKNPADKGKFRTPSLRELKYTAPYMHNGVFATLDEVVAYYNKGGGKHPGKSKLIQPLNLTGDEQKDIVRFLESLSMDAPLTMPIPPLPDYAVLAEKSASDEN